VRHINLEELLQYLPADWEQRAQQALDDVRNSPSGKRSIAVNRHARLWHELGDKLAVLSEGKCWYCESREKRSDNPVDHFRPKNRVDGCAGHEGYWWLAFDWHNYRFSCTYCNSRRKDKVGGTRGGKHDAFPILDETRRAYTEKDDIGREDVELLDPTNPADPGGLWYEEDGRVTEKYKQERQPVLFRRAHTSIELYHLNHVASKEARRELCRRIRRLIELGKVHFDDWQAGNRAAKVGLEGVVEELREFIDKKAEHSATARSMLLGLRHPDHPWIDGVIIGA
jgi:uncharacterized protein (TIGR02646 family)